MSVMGFQNKQFGWVGNPIQPEVSAMKCVALASPIASHPSSNLGKGKLVFSDTAFTLR